MMSTSNTPHYKTSWLYLLPLLILAMIFQQNSTAHTILEPSARPKTVFTDKAGNALFTLTVESHEIVDSAADQNNKTRTAVETIIIESVKNDSSPIAIQLPPHSGSLLYSYDSFTYMQVLNNEESCPLLAVHPSIISLGLLLSESCIHRSYSTSDFLINKSEGNCWMTIDAQNITDSANIYHMQMNKNESNNKRKTIKQFSPLLPTTATATSNIEQPDKNGIYHSEININFDESDDDDLMKERLLTISYNPQAQGVHSGLKGSTLWEKEDYTLPSSDKQHPFLVALITSLIKGNPLNKEARTITSRKANTLSSLLSKLNRPDNTMLEHLVEWYAQKSMMNNKEQSVSVEEFEPELLISPESSTEENLQTTSKSEGLSTEITESKISAEETVVSNHSNEETAALNEKPEESFTVSETSEGAITSNETTEEAVTSNETPEGAITSNETPEEAVTSSETPKVTVTSTETPEVTATSNETPEVAVTPSESHEEAVASNENTEATVVSGEIATEPVVSNEKSEEVVVSEKISDETSISQEKSEEVLASVDNTEAPVAVNDKNEGSEVLTEETKESSASIENHTDTVVSTETNEELPASNEKTEELVTSNQKPDDSITLNQSSEAPVVTTKAAVTKEPTEAKETQTVDDTSSIVVATETTPKTTQETNTTQNNGTLEGDAVVSGEI